ncbi:MAG: hypothetical protein GXP25_02775 [Planctomycetes bacterium]|nr:hypothetical protein [Planctomycetota bacterium]
MAKWLLLPFLLGPQSLPACGLFCFALSRWFLFCLFPLRLPLLQQELAIGGSNALRVAKGDAHESALLQDFVKCVFVSDNLPEFFVSYFPEIAQIQEDMELPQRVPDGQLGHAPKGSHAEFRNHEYGDLVFHEPVPEFLSILDGLRELKGFKWPVKHLKSFCRMNIGTIKHPHVELLLVALRKLRSHPGHKFALRSNLNRVVHHFSPHTPEGSSKAVLIRTECPPFALHASLSEYAVERLFQGRVVRASACVADLAFDHVSTGSLGLAPSQPLSLLLTHCFLVGILPFVASPSALPASSDLASHIRSRWENPSV